MAITVGAPAAVATAPAGSDPPLNSLAFDPKVKGFTTGAAADMAQVSMMVYDNPAKMKADFARLGFNQFKFIEAPGLDQQAIIASDGKRTVVAFRGTENKTDAWVDARKKLVPAPEYQGLAHDGFLEAFRALWPKMKPELDAMRAAGQAVYVTGHSLGGALATLAAAELLRAGKPPDAVYTFGSPRVGNKGFADFYDAGLRDRTFRYVNKSDVVTRVPEVSVTGWIGTDQASIY
jgi:triacylglycerol lipase